MSFVLTTAPAVEPVTLLEAKAHLGINSTFVNDDNLINQLIVASREYAEGYTNRPLITQTWTFYGDGFNKLMELKPNLQSVTNVKYVDNDGVLQTLATAEYSVNTHTLVGNITPAYGKAWPATRSQSKAVEIEFVAGYGLAVNVPASIKQAMLLLIGHWYENRESVIIGTISSETPMAAKMLLNPYRVITL